ncbi:MAG: amidase [Deltaproteobacteria bacterium]|nr:amidase [Deltaproteobacteria bacterium]
MSRVSAFCDDVLGVSDAVAIRRRIREGEISAAEVVEAAVARAQSVNPLLNAIATPLFDWAHAEAMAPGTGAFAGVPSFVKDTDSMKGVPLLFGSRGMPNEPSTKTSEFVVQLHDLGFIMLGKTTTPEFGLTGTTEALVYGPTRNPWNTEHSTGGSSGGAAALVAAGVVPIAHANDGGGSIRIPASCCGIVGLKPSRGRLPDVEGAALLPVKIIHQGVVTRTVRDTAAFYHAAEQHRPNRKLPKIGLVEGSGPRRRIRFFSQWNHGRETDSECVASVERIAKLFEAHGHSVEEVAPPFDEVLSDDFLVLWSTMAFGILQFGRRLIHPKFDKRQVEEFTRGLARMFREHVFSMPAAVHRLRQFGRFYESLFDDCDVLLTPTVATPPPRLGHLGPEVPFDLAIERLKAFVPFSAVQNVSGAPAISLPAGMSKTGLPIGVQLAAALGQERTLLELAFELEESAPWPLICED